CRRPFSLCDAEQEAARGLHDTGRAEDAVMAEPRRDEETRSLPRIGERLAGLDRDLAIVAVVDDQCPPLDRSRQGRDVQLVEPASDPPLDGCARQLERSLIEPERMPEAAEPRLGG